MGRLPLAACFAICLLFTNNTSAFTQEEPFKITLAQTDVNDIKFYYNGRYAAILAYRSGIQLWDLVAKQKIAELTLNALQSDMVKQLRTARGKRHAILDYQVNRLQRDKRLAIRNIAVSDNAKVVALSMKSNIAGRNTSIILWYPLKNQIKPLLYDDVIATTLSRTGKYLALAMSPKYAKNAVKIINLKSNKNVVTIRSKKGQAGLMCFNRKGSKAYFATKKYLYGYRLKNGNRLLKTSLTSLKDKLKMSVKTKACLISNNNKYMYFCSKPNCFIVRLKTGKIVAVKDGAKKGGCFRLSSFRNRLFVDNFLVAIGNNMSKAYLIKTSNFKSILKHKDNYGLNSNELLKLRPLYCDQLSKYAPKFEKYKNIRGLNSSSSAVDIFLDFEAGGVTSKFFYYKNDICIDRIAKQKQKYRHYFSHYIFYLEPDMQQNNTVVSVTAYNYKNVIAAVAKLK